MEWIIVRRRLLAVLVFVLMVVLATTTRVWYASGVSHLNKKELRHFAHQQSQLSHNGIEGGEIPEKAPHE